MIIGIGTDIIEIDRIKAAIERTPSFLNKAFTEKELKTLPLEVIEQIKKDFGDRGIDTNISTVSSSVRLSNFSNI